MKILTWDCETSTFQKGNPYSRCNKLCYAGFLDSKGDYYQFDIEYSEAPYGNALKLIQELIDDHDVLVGFNAKFDVAWLRRYGISFDTTKIFDCQVAEFVLSNQQQSYPSLDATAISYGLEGKLDVVKTEYWDNGIDTPDIPEEILCEYLEQDVRQTYAVYLKQQERLADNPAMHKLIRLQCQDLLVLQEIEQNGLLYDSAGSIAEGDTLKPELDNIANTLIGISGYPDFNIGSGEHLSALLYGGSIKYKAKGQYEFHHKDGRVSIKEKYMDFFHTLPQLVKPLRGSELKKEGYFATDASTLRSLKGGAKVRSIITSVLRAAELEKLIGTYLHGLPAKIKEMDWDDNMIHGQLNQCVARTGRLSSSNPNLQNFSKDLNHLFTTRYV